MSQQYPNGSARMTYSYFSHQQQQPLPQFSLPQDTRRPSYTLPHHPRPSALEDPNSPNSLARPPASSAASTAEATGQSASYYPVYGPTATTSYHASNHNVPNTFHQGDNSGSRIQPLEISSLEQTQSSYSATPRGLPHIAPMPPRDATVEQILRGYGNSEDLSQDEANPEPAHVVGSQGRRGILPSAPGRPDPPTEDSNEQKGNQTPIKDINGRFPCDYCEKKYLHAKHLKRHLLRHTGTRPYVCGLCNDTFSRSDILKRHFNKCSARRGNPTGQSHLAHSRASRKLRDIKIRRDEKAAKSADGSQTNGYTPTPEDESFGFNNLDFSQSHSTGTQVSRANSVGPSQEGVASHSNRTSMGMPNNSGYESTGYATSTGHVTPDSITTSGAATPYTYPHEPPISQLSENGLNRTINSALVFSSSSRPPASSIYSQHLPQIVGNDHGHSQGYAGWSSPHGLPMQAGNYSGSTTPYDSEKPNSELTSFLQYYQRNNQGS